MTLSANDDDDTLLAYKRVDITAFACRMGYKNCVDRSLNLFKEWMNATDPDILNK